MDSYKLPTTKYLIKKYKKLNARKGYISWRFKKINWKKELANSQNKIDKSFRDF